MWTPGPIKAQAPKLLVNMASMQSSAGPSSQWGICGCGEWHLKTNKRNWWDETCHSKVAVICRNLKCRTGSSHRISKYVYAIGIQTLDKWRGKSKQKSTVCKTQLTSSSDCCLDEGIQLLVTTDGELQVTGSDTLHLQVFGGVARQL